MKVCVQGWRGINHSYAMVNQFQLLELAKKPLDLFHMDVPFAKQSWNSKSNANGFSDIQNQVLSRIRTPMFHEKMDIIYRIAYPYNIGSYASDLLFVFGTAEFQDTTDMFQNGNLKSAVQDPNLYIVTPSNWSKTGFLKSGFKSDHVIVIPHGVDPDHCALIDPNKRNLFRSNLNIQDDDFVLLSLGAMTENKGMDLLIIAYAILKTKYKRLKLILKDLSSLYDISAESHVSVLEAFADGKFHTQEILSDIILISNNLTLDQLQGLYGAADCYVSPYRAEGFGLTPLEAAACGTPIIVSKGGATDDYFHPCMGAQVDSQLTTRDGRTELDPDLDSLIEKMESLLMAAENEKTRKFRSKHVHENFSWSKVTEMLWSEFQLKSQQKPE